MDIKLEIYSNEMQAAQLEVLIKILALKKATISLLCDNKSKTVLFRNRLTTNQSKMGIKQQCITKYLTQGTGYRQLAKKYGVRRTTIHRLGSCFTNLLFYYMINEAKPI